MLLLAIFLVHANWYEIQDILANYSVGQLLGSLSLAIFGTIFMQKAWFHLLQTLGVCPDSRQAAGVFYVTQLGKYIPGSIWPMLAQMKFGRRWGASKSVMLFAHLLLLLFIVVTGIFVGAISLTFVGTQAISEYWWVFGVPVAIGVLLHPRVLSNCFRWLHRKAGLEIDRQQFEWWNHLKPVCWLLTAWIVFGIHIVLLIYPFVPLSPSVFIAAIGGFSLAWAVGIVFVAAPAGAGVREAVLVLAISPFIGVVIALTVALASRLLVIFADIVLGAAGAATIKYSSK